MDASLCFGFSSEFTIEVHAANPIESARPKVTESSLVYSWIYTVSFDLTL